ncbi:MAG: low specificity L-threonine aldolase [Muribaculaceae bacterium]|nr:low specificity L-threonine aldolase [Muribaculaceae bacterium]
MLYFNCDYMAGAHPEVLKTLCETNLLHTEGYGNDRFTAEAKRIILEACGLENGAVYFLQGGTQTNKIVIDRLLSRNDGVLCCESAHINVHESGAIEAEGHKVLTLPAPDGKISAESIRKYITDFYRDDTYIHMVRPAMVYISQPTEFGTLYSLKELKEISKVCHENDIPLFIDGARLAYGLAADENDVTLQDIARLSDVFYIGGTKCGALFGEAVVSRRPELLPRFDSLMKLHGALLAKGRLVPLQFITLFSDNLYLRLGYHADRLAMKLKQGFKDKGYRMFIDSPTNQQFFILPNTKIDLLRTEVGMELWGPPGDTESVVRFVTDWTTTEEDISHLLSLL